MRKIFIAVAALAISGVTLAAQTSTYKPEIRPFAGAMIPLGHQRDLFTDAVLVGAEVALELKPSVHVLGTFAWTPAQDKYAVALDNVNIFQYTVGAEFGFVQPLAGDWELRPFLGVGAGARTYAYQDDVLSGKTCTTGYGALGTEFQLGRTALRFEARDNVFCFRSPLRGQGSTTRTDLAFTFGLAYHFR